MRKATRETDPTILIRDFQGSEDGIPVVSRITGILPGENMIPVAGVHEVHRVPGELIESEGGFRSDDQAPGSQSEY